MVGFAMNAQMNLPILMDPQFNACFHVKTLLAVWWQRYIQLKTLKDFHRPELNKHVLRSFMLISCIFFLIRFFLFDFRKFDANLFDECKKYNKKKETKSKNKVIVTHRLFEMIFYDTISYVSILKPEASVMVRFGI